MEKEIYCYSFIDRVPLQEVENTLFLAVLATESLHGAAKVRLEAAYVMSEEKRACVIDARSDVGNVIARIFTGFCIKEFGEDSFKVNKADNVPAGTEIKT